MQTNLSFKQRRDIANWLEANHQLLLGTSRPERAERASAEFGCKANIGHLQTIETECEIDFGSSRQVGRAEQMRDLAESLCDLMVHLKYAPPKKLLAIVGSKVE